MITIEMRVAGIPCLIKAYDIDDYQVCDQRGRPAPWLERKMLERDRENIFDKIYNYQK